MRAPHIVPAWPRVAALGVFALLAAATQDARADDADKAACIDMDEGEACVDSDGEAGTCVADESDPNVLTCEDSVDDDDGGNSNSNSSSSTSSDDDDDDGSCSIGAGSLGALALALVLLGLRRRRR